MNRLTKITTAAIFLAFSGAALADKGADQANAALPASTAGSGAHDLDATDRGGKPDADSDFSFQALLAWLAGQRD